MEKDEIKIDFSNFVDTWNKIVDEYAEKYDIKSPENAKISLKEENEEKEKN